ncbi:MAG TPA: glycosyltransferase family 2 protein [Armatimonadota bacterium]|jgi:hypothetical protein
MDLSVVILNWNTSDDLKRCLKSVESEAAGVTAPATVGGGNRDPHTGSQVSVEVVVVDNASSDGSAGMVREEFPWARVLENARNLGFSAGNNRGIEQSRGRYVLLLNPDTVVHAGAFHELVWFADRHSDAGVVGAKLLNRDGTLQYSCRRFPKMADGLFRHTPLGKLMPRNKFTRGYLLMDHDHGAEAEVDWVSGAAMLLRREVLDQVGLLDAKFFMYCEDVDICYRAKQAGWKVLYCPSSVITHLIARASDQNAARMIIQHHKSMYRFFRKHYAAHTSRWVWPMVVAGLVARCSLLVTKNKIDIFRMRFGL